VSADEKLTAFTELESAIRSATRGKSACYENLPPDREAKPYEGHDCPAFWQSLFGFSNSTFAVRQPSRPNRNRADAIIDGPSILPSYFLLSFDRNA